jgi:hypothetical protein
MAPAFEPLRNVRIYKMKQSAHFSIKADAYAAIEAKYHCDHANRELRLRIIADGRKAYYRQCISCGHAGSAVSAKVARLELQGRVEPSFDDDLEHQCHARKRAEYLATYQEIAPKLRAEYEAYLASDAWTQCRAVALMRANEICECCEHFRATEVHHITYERIGQELDSDLMAVCSFCHGLLHRRHSL